MSFVVYDLALLGIFILLITIFLRRNKHRIKKEGLLLLYKAEWGIKLIHKVGNKYKKSLKILSYVSVVLGYILMIGMIYLAYNIIKIYLLRPDIVSQVKVPPIMPLIPYIDKFVTFLPPFYFTYWIIILAVIAISHEFAHGIFAAYNKVRIKKTGFGFFPFFLPVFLAAFVELDEKKMVKKPNFSQRAILAAGTFANIVTAIVFLIVLGIFFMLAFAPAGVSFDGYVTSVVPIASITMVNNVSVENPTIEDIKDYMTNASFNYIKAEGKNYVGVKGFSGDMKLVELYNSAPAINAGLNGAILSINEIKINSINKLSSELEKYNPGDAVKIKTKVKEEVQIKEITLAEHPSIEGKAWLGVGFSNREGGSIMNRIFAAISSFKKPNVYYESKIGEAGWFIYNLLWWLILISVSVALVNMLPMGIFDGGRFFYLTILALTGNEKLAKQSFSIVTKLFLLLLFAIMAFWAYVVIF
ncbi:site-2 protease family protein [Candidatus Pacearchaeota archaeon]|nr:site-2 protease family protein [Candidatus Pacearchaeota archaeon]